MTSKLAYCGPGAAPSGRSGMHLAARTWRRGKARPMAPAGDLAGRVETAFTLAVMAWFGLALAWGWLH